MRPAAPLLLSLLLTASSAVAADPLAEPPPAPAAGREQAAVLSADLRDEYLAGERLIVVVKLSNSGSSPLVVPDLSARPWLVRFAFTLPNGSKQSRYTTAPEVDPGTTWTIPPRGSRQVSLMVPSAEALPPGSYTLGVEVDLGGATLRLEPRPVRLAPPNPVAAHLAPDGTGTERAGLLSTWVHRGTGGFDLYLNSFRGRSVAGSGTNTWLTRLSSQVSPQLSAARSSDALDRHIVWPQGSSGVGYAAVEGGALAGAAGRIDTPWPSVVLIGQSATDGEGALQVPLWVPAPKGSAGELRVLSVDRRGKPLFRRVVKLDSPPNAVVPVVDAGGGAHFLVQQGPHLDLYSVRTGDTEGLPLSGRRLWTVEATDRFETARFITLEQDQDLPGGLALFVATRRTLEGADQLNGQLVTMTGRAIRALPSMSIPSDATVLAVMPRGAQPVGALLRTAEGLTWREGDQASPIAALPKAWAVARDREGNAALLGLAAGAGVRATSLLATPPTP